MSRPWGLDELIQFIVRVNNPNLSIPDDDDDDAAPPPIMATHTASRLALGISAPSPMPGGRSPVPSTKHGVRFAATTSDKSEWLTAAADCQRGCAHVVPQCDVRAQRLLHPVWMSQAIWMRRRRSAFPST